MRVQRTGKSPFLGQCRVRNPLQSHQTERAREAMVCKRTVKRLTGPEQDLVDDLWKIKSTARVKLSH